MILKPRPYQEESFHAVWAGVERGLRRTAIVLPCGSGKTVIFAHLSQQAYDARYRVLILVHRDKLIKQAVQKLHSIAPDLSVGVIKGTRNELGHDVTVASVQTLSRTNRLLDIQRDAWNFIIVDECHHAPAPGYQRILNYFGAFDDSAPVTLPGGASRAEVMNSVSPGAYKRQTLTVGLTATPGRQDNLGLGDTFEEIVYTKDIPWMIERGYLVDPVGLEISVDLDMADVSMTAGDYGVGSLGRAINASNTGPAVAAALREHAQDRQAVVFMPDVASTYQMTAFLLREGFTAECITGETSDEDRDLIDKRIETGETQIFVNCLVATEGYDCPQLSVAVICRLTQNNSLFTQMAGRVLRPWTGHDDTSPYPWMRKPKTDALILMLGTHNGQRLATMACLVPSVLSHTRDGESLTEAMKREESDPAITEMLDGWRGKDNYKTRSRNVDLFMRESHLRFKTTEKGYRYIPTQDWLVAVLPRTTAPDTLYTVGLIWSGRGAARKGRKIVPEAELGYALAWAEETAKELDPTGTASRRKASWRMKREPPSEKQLKFAQSLGISVPEGAFKRDVGDLIDTSTANRLLDRYTPRYPETEEVD